EGEVGRWGSIENMAGRYANGIGPTPQAALEALAVQLRSPKPANGRPPINIAPTLEGIRKGNGLGGADYVSRLEALGRDLAAMVEELAPRTTVVDDGRRGRPYP